MEFKNNSQAIYLQIADYVCERVLLKEWLPENKIPSVRDLAVQMEVNPNTVARSYDFLKQQNIIYDKRGVGYFITADALQSTVVYRKKEFTEKELPSIFRTMFMLGLGPEYIKDQYEIFKKQ